MNENRSRFAAAAAASLLLLVTVVPALALSKAAPAAAGDAPACVHELVYEPYRGLMILKVAIGDSPPLDFIVDSGANITTINDAYLAAALNLRYLHRGRARGVGVDPVEVLLAPDVALRTEGALLFRSNLAIHHVPSLIAGRSGREVHGLLGAELFDRYVVEIDPLANRILLHDPDSFVYQGDGRVLRLRIDGGRPFVDAVVTTMRDKRARVRLLVDTGSAATIGLIKDSHRFLRLPERHTTMEIVGVGGATEAYVGRIRRLELGALVLDDLVAGFIPRYAIPAMRGVKRLNGIVGNGLLRRFHSFLDYRRLRLILEKDPRYDRPVVSRRLGLETLPSWPDLLTLRVTSVTPGGPAALAGVEVGDLVVAVDGLPVDRPGLEQGLGSSEAETDEVRTLRLTIRRGQEILEATLRLR